MPRLSENMIPAPPDAIALVQMAARIYVDSMELPDWYAKGRQHSLSSGGISGLTQAADDAVWEALRLKYPHVQYSPLS